MAVAKKPAKAKSKSNKPVAKKKAIAPDGGSKAGLNNALKKTSSLDLNQIEAATELKSKKSIPHLIIGEPLPETPLFNDAGDFRLKEFLSNKQAFLLNHAPLSVMHQSLTALINLESIYLKLGLDKDHGDFSATALNKDLAEHAYDNNLDALNQIIVAFRSLCSWIKFYCDDRGSLESERALWNSYSVVNLYVGYLNHAAGIDPEVYIAQGREMEMADNPFIRKKDDTKRNHIKKLMKTNPTKRYKNLFDLADKEIIGSISQKTFSNICSEIATEKQT